ncbi:MAG TPA: DUF5317 domain-containing protein [Actinomycetota bacterium]|nr:DUF5317 domain-containing protein [Actinomycetota bacterium]
MRLILATLGLALAVGYLVGGRAAGLVAARLRWWWLAFAGLALQLLPLSGTPGFVVLVASFVLLVAFCAANLRAPGLWLIALGLSANLVVIAANRGMPVTREALVASGQGETLRALRLEGGAKHHLADRDDELLPLADVIPLGPPIRQTISVGDVLVHAGAFWFVVASMRRARSTRTRGSRVAGKGGRGGI